jgi:hypothetical protein
VQSGTRVRLPVDPLDTEGTLNAGFRYERLLKGSYSLPRAIVGRKADVILGVLVQDDSSASQRTLSAINQPVNLRALVLENDDFAFRLSAWAKAWP